MKKIGINRPNLPFLLTNNALTKSAKDIQSKDTVIAFKLDSFNKILNIESNDLIKIDVEGFEHLVIKGSKKIISNNFPMLFIEIESRHSNKEQIESILKFLYEECYESFCYFKESKVFEKIDLTFEEMEFIQKDSLNTKNYINNFLFLNKKDILKRFQY